MNKKEIVILVMYVLAKIAQLSMIAVALYFMMVGEYEKGGSVFVAVIAMALLDISMEAVGIKEELKRFNDLAEDVLGEDEEDDVEVSIDGLSQKSGVTKVRK